MEIRTIIVVYYKINENRIVLYSVERFMANEDIQIKITWNFCFITLDTKPLFGFFVSN